ncbi:reverse transcriptase domain-containing protein [Leadbetterella byssophila]|uniref:reverse transcriptase domain-containing protein n=1 Tax=Leadbetterella byssophila TaxID=316068 RepID=UPI0002E3079F|nr:reverse transcriptase domain-containing protein [Leadbetterella byssophila]
MIDYYETKQHPITKKMVLDAYRKVRANKGSAGIDTQSLEQFEERLADNLYKIWNRMTSGSYHPKAVREVQIPKKSGGYRGLGIPTVSDRVAQQVVKSYLEPKVEPSFHQDSYGYRPNKSAHDALAKTVRNCGYYSWVVDLDIRGFFDNIDHELLMKAVCVYTDEKWIIMYIERWLEVGVVREGKVHKREKGHLRVE